MTGAGNADSSATASSRRHVLSSTPRPFNLASARTACIVASPGSSRSGSARYDDK